MSEQGKMRWGCMHANIREGSQARERLGAGPPVAVDWAWEKTTLKSEPG